jgi:RNA polymerase sigma-70 factor (ECF subfamily)
VSQAALRLVQFIETNDPPLLEIDALFWRVMRNLAIDQHRKARRAARIYDHSVDLCDEADQWRLPQAACDTHKQLMVRQELAAVQRRVERLPEETRDLFVHRFVEDRSYREIARDLHISEALARKRVQKLRALIVEPQPTGGEEAAPPSQNSASHVYHHEAV